MRSFKAAQIVAIVVVALERLATQSSAPTSPPGYAGSEICGSCHEDLARTLADNPHHAVELEKNEGWEGRACEACHGFPQKHTESAAPEDTRNPAKVATAAANKTCRTCHPGQSTLAGHRQSTLAENQVACTTCHEIHTNGAAGMVPRTAAAISAQGAPKKGVSLPF